MDERRPGPGEPVPAVDGQGTAVPRADRRRPGAGHARRARGPAGTDGRRARLLPAGSPGPARGERRQDRHRAARRQGRGPVAALARELDQAWREAWALLRGAPQGRVVRTRHGDRMLLTEFVRTRVLELAVHGLDLAASLARPPWLTGAAAAVVEENRCCPPVGPAARGKRLGPAHPGSHGNWEAPVQALRCRADGTARTTRLALG